MNLNLKMLAVLGCATGLLAFSPGQKENPPAKQTSPTDPTVNNPDVPHQEPGTNNPDMGKQRQSTSAPDSGKQEGSSTETGKAKKSHHRKSGKSTGTTSQTSQ